MPKSLRNVQRAAAWSESAFREVYSRYIKPVNAYILRRVRNPQDAEDLTAQVFAQALKNLDPSKAGSKEVASYLFTSARNASTNHAVRGRKFRATISIEELPESDIPVSGADPSQLLLDEEQLESLLEAIARLPEERRRALILRFVEELPHSEIADALGRSETSARVLLHRTVAKLRKEVS